MVQLLDGDGAIGILVILVAREIRLRPRIETAAADCVRVANDVEVAADGHMLDANQLGDVVDVIEHMFERHRLSIAHHEADERDSHHAAGLCHPLNRFVGLAAKVSRQERTRRGMRKDDRPLRCRERVERRLIAAVRHVDSHSLSLHPFQDRGAEDGETTVALFEKPAADAVAEVVGQLRDSLPEPEERADVIWSAKVGGVLKRQHHAGLAGRLRPRKIRHIVYPREPFAVGSKKPVPVRVVADRAVVIPGAVPEREYGDARVAIPRQILRREAARDGQPLLALRWLYRIVGKLKLVQQIDHHRRANQLDRTGGVICIRLSIELIAAAQYRWCGDRGHAQGTNRTTSRDSHYWDLDAAEWTIRPSLMT
jgi:hypothetical protein